MSLSKEVKNQLLHVHCLVASMPCRHTVDVGVVSHPGEADYVVVGLSSHVITERDASVAPRDQLADAPSFFSTKKPNNFTFTHDVCSYIYNFSVLPSLNGRLNGWAWSGRSLDPHQRFNLPHQRNAII